MDIPNYWTLKEGLELVRAIQPETRRFGYHLTLGGGVLNSGESKKDLDLFFLPLDPFNGGINPDPKSLVEWLNKQWGEGKDLFKEYMEFSKMPVITNPVAEQNRVYFTIPTDVVAFEDKPPKKSPYHSKIKYNYCGLRVDVFVIEP